VRILAWFCGKRKRFWVDKRPKKRYYRDVQRVSCKNKTVPMMYRIGSFFITVGLIFGPVVSPASAATLPYAAQVGTGETSIPAGESRQITLKFKNVGSQTWIGGSTKTAVYLYGNSSIFGHSSWPKNDLGVPIAQAKVAPGSHGFSRFLGDGSKNTGIIYGTISSFLWAKCLGKRFNSDGKV
jgi:hypothetical protein